MPKMGLAVFLLEKTAEWSLYILIFTLPFSKSLVEITIVTALISVVVKKLVTKERILPSSRIDILLYIFLIACLISLFNTAYMALSLRAFFSKSLKFAALFLVTKEVMNTRQRLNNFLTIALLSCVIIVIDGFTQYFITHVDFLHNYPAFKTTADAPRYLGFPTASFPFPNDYAAWILVFIFPTGAFAVMSKSSVLKKAILGIVWTSLAYSLILTKARGAWMGFLVASVLLLFVRLKKVYIFSLAIILVGAYFVSKPLKQDLISLTSVNDRITMWKNGWEIFKKHPIIGNGLNTFYVNYAEIREDEFKGKKGSYAHNCYLQTAAETGLAGLISFLVFVIAVILKGFVSARTARDPPKPALALGISLGLVAFLVHSFVDTNLYSLNLAALFWVSAGFLMAVVRIAER